MAPWLHDWPRSLQDPLVNSGVFCIRMDTRLMCANMAIFTVYLFIQCYGMDYPSISIHILIASAFAFSHQ